MKNFLIFLIFSFIVYGGSLMYGFSQDDWYFLAISKASNLQDVLRFFSPWDQQGFPFYRPLGTQLYFYLATLLGGLTFAPLLMHSLMLILHAIGGYLLVQIAKARKFGDFKATLVGLLYVGSSVHFLSLYYIAATQQLLATTFMLLVIYLTHQKRSRYLAYFVYALALLSKENAVLLPLYLFILSNWTQVTVQRVVENVKRTLPFGVMAMAYLGLRLTRGIEVQSEYHPELGVRVISTLKIYLSFVLGYYEKIQDYVLPQGMVQYLVDTNPYGYLTVAGSTLSIILVSYALISALISKRLMSGLPYLLVFALGLVPWLLLPDHIFPHYLDLPMAGLALFLIALTNNKTLAAILTVCMVVAGYGGIKSSEMLHWTVLRARLNTRVVPQLISRGLCDSQQVVLVGDELLARELSYSLSLSNGPRVLCNNPDLQVYYKGEVIFNATELSLGGL
jgi:hypothetical protein